MSETIFVSIDTDEEITVTTAETFTTTVQTSEQNAAVLESLGNIGDVDVATNGKNNGSILVYKTTTNKWTATTTLDAQNMEGGEF
jgi:hypothetical protein